ncbi:MAG: SNF2-related protein, partial [Nitrospiraceae bacterium]
NAADLRVYQLLDQKFRLFNGVFGASDEVLGAVESGVDFEKRIATIYQKCRTPEQIQFEFDALQRDLETEIAEGQRDAREKLLNNFDQDVVEKVRIQSRDYLDRFEERLWKVTQHLLAPYARFEEPEYSFTLERNPFPGETIHPGPYRMGKNVEDANTYRVGHPLAQRLLAQAKSLSVQSGEVIFRYPESGKNITILEPLKGKGGWLMCVHVTLTALETEDHLILAGVADSSEAVDGAQCRRLFDLPGEENGAVSLPAGINETLEGMTVKETQEHLESIAAKNGVWFETEMDKLDRWADDRRASLKTELDELDDTIKETKKAARLAPNLPEKLERQRAMRHLESKRTEAWKAFDEASREIDGQKDAVLDEISQRLHQKTERVTLFTIRWRLA